MQLDDRQVILRADGKKSPYISISLLPDELLLEIFDLRRLANVFGWNHQREWYTPLHVCRKWRYTMLQSAFRLKLRLLCDSETPVAEMLLHSPPLPLIFVFRDYELLDKSEENTLLALQHADRVFSLFFDHWNAEQFFMILNKTFPALETLLLEFSMQPLVLPDKFAAPRLRAVHLHNVNVTISVTSSLLTNAAANLISLRLEDIQYSSYLSPKNLVERISCMRQLENLSISFALISPPPDKEWELRDTYVMLPSLRRFTYRGQSANLEKMLALISTPLLRCFIVTFFRQRILEIQSLSRFLGTIQNLNFRTTVVSFTGSVSVTIAYQPRRQPSESPFCLMFDIDLNDHGFSEQVAAVEQIHTAVVPALHVVEGLALEFDCSCMPNTFAGCSELWHAFLRSFNTIKTLWVAVVLAPPELFDVLNPDNETATEELLPMLSELVVVSKIDLVRNPFSSLIRARRLAGRPIDFRVIKQSPFLPPFSFLWTSDAFEYTI